jgi:hypothetical protein
MQCCVSGSGYWCGAYLLLFRIRMTANKMPWATDCLTNVGCSVGGTFLCEFGNFARTEEDLSFEHKKVGVWASPKELVGAPDHMTVSHHSKQRGGIPLLSPSSLFCNLCIKELYLRRKYNYSSLNLTAASFTWRTTHFFRSGAIFGSASKRALA